MDVFQPQLTDKGKSHALGGETVGCLNRPRHHNDFGRDIIEIQYLPCHNPHAQLLAHKNKWFPVQFLQCILLQHGIGSPLPHFHLLRPLGWNGRNRQRMTGRSCQQHLLIKNKLVLDIIRVGGTAEHPQVNLPLLHQLQQLIGILFHQRDRNLGIAFLKYWKDVRQQKSTCR